MAGFLYRMRGDDSGKCDPFRHPPIFLRRQTGLLGDAGERRRRRRVEEEGGAAAHPLKDDLLPPRTGGVGAFNDISKQCTCACMCGNCPPALAGPAAAVGMCSSAFTCAPLPQARWHRRLINWPLIRLPHSYLLI